MGHRLLFPSDLTADTLAQETRFDLLAVIACGAVLTNGVSKLDVTSALAQSVPLDGVSLEGTVITTLSGATNDQTQKASPMLSWAMESFLTATPAKTVVLMKYHDESWTSLAMTGIAPRDPSLPSSPLPPPQRLPSNKQPILNRYVSVDSPKRSETYLPTLQALPGKVEFSYLPPNTQEALVLPVNDDVVLVLGSNTSRSFTPRDIAWCQVLAERVDGMLST
mmetsp:Transcript_9335/g.21532  ORF Transcript_9335/g.21532 Transcript_9335/m.21532 type:complete len:222 (+) Transcript_9335:2-667(+)